MGFAGSKARDLETAPATVKIFGRQTAVTMPSLRLAAQQAGVGDHFRAGVPLNRFLSVGGFPAPLLYRK
jgi:hypothetical protein